MEDYTENFDVVKKLSGDNDIKSESYLISYLTLVTENIRTNNNKITRNSFWLLTSFIFYILIKNYDSSIKNITIQFITIENNQLFLNLIPVFFSFIFFQNVTLWNNNLNLLNIFDKLTTEMFSLGVLSDTKNIIRPFSLLHHVINYQYNNKKIHQIFKLPLNIAFLIIVILPVIFQIYAIYGIAINKICSFIPVASATLITVLLLATIIQALNSTK